MHLFASGRNTFSGLSDVDKYRRIIDAYRLKATGERAFRADNHGWVHLTNGSEQFIQLILSRQSSPLPDFERFVGLAKQRRLLPKSWDAEKDEPALFELAMSDDWSNLGNPVVADDIVKHYDDKLLPLILRFFAERVEGDCQ